MEALPADAERPARRGDILIRGMEIRHVGDYAAETSVAGDDAAEEIAHAAADELLISPDPSADRQEAPDRAAPRFAER